MEGKRKDRNHSRLRTTLVWFAVGLTIGVLVAVSLTQPRISVENLSVTYLDSCSFAVSFDLWKRDNDELGVVYQIFVNDVAMLSPPGELLMEAKGFWPVHRTVSASPWCSADAIVSARILETYPYVD